MYQLEGTPADLRRMTLMQFRKHAAVTDPRVVDIMLAKAEMEFEETIEQWKQRGHLMQLLDPELPAPDPLLDSEELFRRFIDGTLTSKDVWKDFNRAEQLRILTTVAADPEAGERVSAEDLHKWARKWKTAGAAGERRPAAPPQLA
jgi:hypothetical protein